MALEKKQLWEMESRLCKRALVLLCKGLHETEHTYWLRAQTRAFKRAFQKFTYRYMFYIKDR